MMVQPVISLTPRTLEGRKELGVYVVHDFCIFLTCLHLAFYIRVCTDTSYFIIQISAQISFLQGNVAWPLLEKLVLSSPELFILFVPCCDQNKIICILWPKYKQKEDKKARFILVCSFRGLGSWLHDSMCLSRTSLVAGTTVRGQLFPLKHTEWQ